MDGIKIDVIGNVAKVIKKPSRITSGTVGLPIEYTFDEQWDGLTKVAVFKGGAIEKSVDLVADLVVPWEVLLVPGVWLSVGVYGANEDGSVAIPTIWANVLPVSVGVDPEGDPSTDPTLPIWADVLQRIADVYTELDKYDPTYGVRYIEQTLTKEQKMQARDNIGAASVEFVATLPESDIDDNVAYCVLEGTFVAKNRLRYDAACHTVSWNSVPTEPGQSAVYPLNGLRYVGYYNIKDNEVYGYVSNDTKDVLKSYIDNRTDLNAAEKIALNLIISSMSVGWKKMEDIIGSISTVVQVSWGGVIYSIQEIADDTKLYVLVGSQTYYHNNGVWISDVAAVGRYGDAADAEVFNSLTNIATGQSSHAEGYSTEADGHYSHAEGFESKALHEAAHAEGYSATASGLGSHAEGQDTQATGNNAHAEGQGATSSGTGSHAEGVNTESTSWGSHAEGGDTKATGHYSHSEGYLTEAVAKYAHAEGHNTVALGEAAHAEGHGTKAYSPDSHAEGAGSVASGTVSHAEGYNTSASKCGAHAEGGGTEATGEYAHAEGYLTHAIGYYAHSEGNDTTASGTAAHAEGQGTQATGSNSHAEGLNTQATYYYSHAEGANTKATGEVAHAEGLGAEASGAYSHAEGQGSKATSARSHAEGHNTVAKADAAHAGGKGTIAAGVAQTAIGEYNIEDTDSLFIVGNGESDTSRNNAFTVNKDGTATVEKVGENGNSVVNVAYFADRIIEIGTEESTDYTGTWYWEKWASGKAVCWGAFSIGDVAATTAWGDLYESTGYSKTLPDGLFVAAPDTVDLTVSKSDSAMFVTRFDGTDVYITKDNIGRFTFSRPTIRTVKGVYIGVHAIGRWK